MFKKIACGLLFGFFHLASSVLISKTCVTDTFFHCGADEFASCLSLRWKYRPSWPSLQEVLQAPKQMDLFRATCFFKQNGTNFSSFCCFCLHFSSLSLSTSCFYNGHTSLIVFLRKQLVLEFYNALSGTRAVTHSIRSGALDRNPQGLAVQEEGSINIYQRKDSVGAQKMVCVCVFCCLKYTITKTQKTTTKQPGGSCSISAGL